MKKVEKIIIATLFVLALCFKTGFAQSALPDSTLTDTLPAYDENIKSADLSQARPFPYPKMNPANIRLYAKVWRIIDLADTANAILTIPGHSLMESILKGIQKGKLTPYMSNDYKKKLNAKQAKERFADSVLVPKFDKDGNQVSSKMVLNEFNPDVITKFRIEEDIFFDKQRGRVDVRIIGLAPMMSIGSSAGLPANMSNTPAFWLYFPQLRYALVQEDVSDADKGIFNITLDDVFMQHKFSASLVKEFSPSGSQTEQLDPGSPEALKIEQKLNELRKNIWKNPRGIDDKKIARVNDTKDTKKEATQ